MLVPFRAYQPMRLDSMVPQSLTVEALLSQPVFMGKMRISNRSVSATMEVVVQEYENLGLSADPLFTGQSVVRRLLIGLKPGEVVWVTFSAPCLEPYNETNSAIPILFHTVTVANQAASPTVDDIVGVSLYGAYEDARPRPYPNPVSTI